MNYAIEVLQKEANLIEECLSEWELNKYPEARKVSKKSKGEEIKGFVFFDKSDNKRK